MFFRIRRVQSVFYLAIVLSSLFSSGRSTAQEAETKLLPSKPLPLKTVVMFTSGVGYYEHTAEIDGNQKVKMKFDVEDISDLLKSMVVEDQGGGTITSVNYESSDPLQHTLRTFAIDLTRNPSLTDLFRQLRGQKVKLDIGATVEGVIVGVERRRTVTKSEQVYDADFVNLKTATGLRSIPVGNIQETQLLDAALDKEFQRVLELIAASHSQDKKAVTLDFRGQGKRKVRIGYVQESPVWKTSYRVVLKDDQPPHLQGWAIVENTTDEDWNDVRLTLVSGRPISFVMDLYQPLFMQRPIVVPELFQGLRPKTHDQDLASREEEFRRTQTASSGRGGANMGGGGGFFGGGGMGGMGGGMGGSGGSGGGGGSSRTPIDSTKSAPARATAAEVGELFQYDIQEPVTITRQESAMLPIVNEKIAGEKVWLFNPTNHDKHPLAGIKLKNATKLHLMQGPVTVFDGGTYAGDARIADIPPGSERFVTYALDLQTEVISESLPLPNELLAIRIRGGSFHFSEKGIRQKKYTVKNGGQKTKRVLIEQPYDAIWTLTAPTQATEKTRSLYRFAVAAEPGKPISLTVREEQTIGNAIAILTVVTTKSDEPLSGTVNTNGPRNPLEYNMRFVLEAKVTSPAVKAAIAEIVSRREALAKIDALKDEVDRQVTAILTEQSRIRQNMVALAGQQELINRYVKKVTEQEDQLAKFAQRYKELSAEHQEKTAAFQKYLAGLDVD